MYTYNYPHPAVTADCLVFARTDEGMKLLLIQRKNEPCKGKWAIPPVASWILTKQRLMLLVVS